MTLLPVLGKLAERVIAGWLAEEVEGNMSGRQYVRHFIYIYVIKT